MAGISFFLKLNGFPAINSNFLIKALKGSKKNFPCIERRRPISLVLLLSLYNILPEISFSEFECCLFRTTFLLAFFTALHISELVPMNKYNALGLFLDDASIKHDHFNSYIRRSKTHSLGKGIWIVINSFPGSLIFPVKALKLYLGIRPQTDGVLLLHRNR